MYKYKKTIIINNRRRRIFSKEKSNTEYILYKKEYITLNAYNKKTGGGMLNAAAISNPINFITRLGKDSDAIEEFDDIKISDIETYLLKIKFEIISDINRYFKKNEAGFIQNINLSNINLSNINDYLSTIKSKIESDIKLNLLFNLEEIKKYVLKIKSPNISDINLEPYNLGASQILLSYLISQSLLKSTNNRVWIITSNDKVKLKLKGYNSESAFFNERNLEKELIKYGTNDEKLNNLIKEKFGTFIFDSLKADITLLKFNTASYINADGRQNYDELASDNNAYIYYYTTDYNILSTLGLNHILIEGEDYKLFNSTFRCIKINVTKTDDNFTYDILFKYISKSNTADNIIKYKYQLQKGYFELFESYLSNKITLYYNRYVNADGRRTYDLLHYNNRNYYICIVEEFLLNKEIREGEICERYGTKFKYDKILIDMNGKYNVLLKYIGDFATEEDIIKYGLLYKKSYILGENALLYYKYVNLEGQKIYDELFKKDKYIYYAKKFLNSSREILEYTKDNESKLFNTNANFKCDNIMREYPSSYESTIVYKYIGNTPTAVAVAVGGQRKLKNLKSKKYLK